MTTEGDAEWDAAIQIIETERLALLEANQIPEAERQKRCAMCWCGLSRCLCPEPGPTVPELLRDMDPLW